MLRALTIRDFVIVDNLELEFQPGFTVLTGETGAGKSILIDALELVLGERGEAIVVRQGAERAEISAEFDIGGAPALSSWLSEHELGADADACLLRRVIDATGRSRAFINGRPATIAQLREAGEHLVDIHGQHQHQSLLRAPAQRELLDAFGGLQALVSSASALYRSWQQHAQRQEAFETQSAARLAEREQLAWQARELEALSFSQEAWDTLVGDHARLSHAASLIEGAQFGLEALSEGDGSALSQLNAVIARLNTLLAFDSTLADALGVLDPARIQIQEAVYTLRHYQQKLDLDPQRLRDIERRLDAVHSICRKYKIEPEGIPELHATTRKRLAEIEATADPELLKKLEAEARAAYMAEAQKLSAGRTAAAGKLAAEVTAAMQTLAMTGGVFEVALDKLAEPALYGLEHVEFRVAAHRSMAPQPLAKVASGGELSRLSLAIQTVTSWVAQVPTLVFDEVDAGIGGRVAEIVGHMLKQLGRKHQVMCITHLPQVAASADHQWQVARSETKAKVSSRVTTLDREQRVDEIARMLGGARITETTRKHAAELLGSPPRETSRREREKNV